MGDFFQEKSFKKNKSYVSDFYTMRIYREDTGKADYFSDEFAEIYNFCPFRQYDYKEFNHKYFKDFWT